MSVSLGNNLISLQETQLIQMLQGQAARSRTESGEENRRAWMAAGGQNLPGANGIKDPETMGPKSTGDEAPTAAMEPIDPSFSPENITALVQALETQQASLDTTVLLSGSSAGPGGRTLIDYLTSPTEVSNAANDDGELRDVMP